MRPVSPQVELGGSLTRRSAVPAIDLPVAQLDGFGQGWRVYPLQHRQHLAPATQDPAVAVRPVQIRVQQQPQGILIETLLVLAVGGPVGSYALDRSRADVIAQGVRSGALEVGGMDVEQVRARRCAHSCSSPSPSPWRSTHAARPSSWRPTSPACASTSTRRWTAHWSGTQPASPPAAMAQSAAGDSTRRCSLGSAIADVRLVEHLDCVAGRHGQSKRKNRAEHLGEGCPAHVPWSRWLRMAWVNGKEMLLGDVREGEAELSVIDPVSSWCHDGASLRPG